MIYPNTSYSHVRTIPPIWHRVWWGSRVKESHKPKEASIHGERGPVVGQIGEEGKLCIQRCRVVLTLTLTLTAPSISAGSGSGAPYIGEEEEEEERT